MVMLSRLPACIVGWTCVSSIKTMTSEQAIRWLFKPILFIVCLVPLALFIFDAFNENLSPDPIKDATLFTGEWTIRFLLVTLAVTPLRKLTGIAKIVQFRRMLGLYAFFYATLHFLVWFWLDRELALAEVLSDIVKRPYITVGFTAFILLIPLAVTSNRYSIRRLGRRWQSLHKLVYVIAVLGVLHFLWLVKADVLEPVIYGLLLLGLLVSRAWWQRRANKFN